MWRVSESRTDTANRQPPHDHEFRSGTNERCGSVGDLPTRHLSCTTPGQAGPLTHSLTHSVGREVGGRYRYVLSEASGQPQPHHQLLFRELPPQP